MSNHNDICLSISTFGNSAIEPNRLRFCNYLVRLADLDAYPRRAAFVAAFSAGGSIDDRVKEAIGLAQSGRLTDDDIDDAIYWFYDHQGQWLACDSDEIR